MSLLSRAKKRVKRVTRKVSRVTLRPAVYTTGVIAAAGTYFGGPVAGAALTAIGSQVVRYQGTVAARDKGMSGRAARAYGRTYMKRAIVAGAIGTTAGFAAAVTVGALGVAGTGAGGNAVAGTAGSNLLFGTPAQNATFVTATNLAAQQSSPVPGIVTSLGDVGAHGATPAAAAAASSGTGGIFTTLMGAAVTGASSGLAKGINTKPGSTGAVRGDGDILGKLAAMGAAAADQASGGGLGGLLNGQPQQEVSPVLLVAILGGAILLAA